MITFYGRRTSDNVQKALWALLETGVAHTVIEKGGAFGGLDDAGFLALNPHGRVPVVVDGDTVVWESTAIIRYLAAEYAAGTLWPEAPRDRAVADQWMTWAQGTLYPDFNRLFWLTVRTPEADQDPARIDQVNTRLNLAYQKLETQLEGRRFIVGDHLTMADFPTGATLYRYFGMAIERPALPCVQAWYGRLQERPAYREAVMVDFDSLRGRLAF